MLQLVRFVSAIAAIYLLTGSSALAVDLRNEDRQTVDVVVTSSSMTKTLKVPPRSLQIVICVGTCVFEAPGLGRVEAAGSDVVAVKDGALRHRPAQVAVRRR